jgi:hypothetical protein
MSSQQNDGLKTQNVPNKGHDVDEESFTSVTQGIMDACDWLGGYAPNRACLMHRSHVWLAAHAI